MDKAYISKDAPIPPEELGRFEVYFEGVLIFSKLLRNCWPNYQIVATQCKEAYMALVESSDNFREYEAELQRARLERIQLKN